MEVGTATLMKGIRIDGPPYEGRVVEDYIALEAPVNIYVNDRHLVTLFATPTELKELAVGHLIGEGVIDGLDDLENITVDGFDILAYVRIDEEKLEKRIEGHRNIRLIYSSCGSIEDYMRALDRVDKPRVLSSFKLKAEKLRELITKFGRGSKSFKHSISVHTSAIYDGKEDNIAYFSEDVSRHVTVDKIIGKAIMNGVNLDNAVLLTTGRQASDMVMKAARVGIPITVSLRGPLFSGVYTAMKTGITMISIVRGKGLTIYSHHHRIIF